MTKKLLNVIAYSLYPNLSRLLPPASGGLGNVLFSVCLSVHTQWEGVPTFDRGVPTLDGGRGTYLGQGEGVTTLDRERGYLPWMGIPTLEGEGVPTLDGRGVPTFRLGEGYLRWMGGGGTYLG